MKIALVGPTHPFRGGISTYTTLLYRHLRRRHDTSFYAFRRQYPTWLFPGRSDRDPSAQGLIEPGAQKVLDGLDPTSFLRLGLRLRRDPPDLLLVPWWVAYWAPHYLALTRTARAGTIVFLMHNVHEHEDRVLKRWITRFVLQAGDAFLVNSTTDRDNLRGLMPGARIVEGYLPTNAEQAPPTMTPGEARRWIGDEHGVAAADGTPLILFFGFVRPYKGLDLLIDAMPEVRSDAHLLVVGEFWKDSRREIDEQMSRLGVGGRVTVVDSYVPNERLAAYFLAADVVALPYRSGTGSAILQTAFGYGRPVVATRVGSLADAVRHERTGLLVPPDSPAELARGINRFFELEGQVPFGEEIARDVETRFSWDALVDTITGLCD